MVTEPGSAAPRRTQEERRAGTRKLLLSATIESLAELGYSGATTLDVERRAGVSRGARAHHFPSKAALLAAAIDHLYEQLANRYALAFGGPKRRSTAPQRLRHGLRLLWSIYERPEYGAVIELNAAARVDAELRQQLQLVAKRHRQLALRAALEFFPTLGETRAQALIETVHATFMGLRLQGGIVITQRQIETVLGALEDLVALHLETDVDKE